MWKINSHVVRSGPRGNAIFNSGSCQWSWITSHYIILQHVTGRRIRPQARRARQRCLSLLVTAQGICACIRFGPNVDSAQLLHFLDTCHCIWLFCNTLLDTLLDTKHFLQDLDTSWTLHPYKTCAHCIFKAALVYFLCMWSVQAWKIGNYHIYCCASVTKQCSKMHNTHSKKV